MTGGQSVSQKVTVNKSGGESLSKSARQSVSPLISQSVGWSSTATVSRLFFWSVSHSTGQPFNKLMRQLLSQSVS